MRKGSEDETQGEASAQESAMNTAPRQDGSEPARERRLLRSRAGRTALLRSLAVAAWVLGVALVLALAQGSAPQGSAPAAGAAPAQKPAGSAPELPPPSPRGQIRVRVEVVNVPVTVLDHRGLPVLDLNQNDFEVYEDGQRQAIRYFSREVQPPLRIGLVLDTSNSARPQLPFQKDAATEFVFTMLQGRSSKNEIFLETFDATSSIVQDFTNDPEILNEKIVALKAGGGKALYDAIYFACKEKMPKTGPPENTRRVLVLISNGLDVQSTHTLDEALSIARHAETRIYAIGNASYGFSNPGDVILERIAANTGGAAYFPLRKTPGTDMLTGYLSPGQIGETSQNKGLGAETGAFSAQRLVQLADSLEAIGRELNDQYNLAYTPAKSALDGTYRTIKVVVRRKNLEVRWKPGYFAVAE
jgi:Ca-activated chloride channel homolog